MLLLYYIYCASVAQDTRITLLLLATSAVTSGNEGRGLCVQHEFKPPHVTLKNKGEAPDLAVATQLVQLHNICLSGAQT